MASAVVSIGPEPDRLASRSAAAHIVVDRGMLNIIFYHYVLIGISRVSKLGSETENLSELGKSWRWIGIEKRTVRVKIKRVYLTCQGQ